MNNKSNLIIIWIPITMVGAMNDFKTWIVPFFICIVGYYILLTLEKNKP